MAQQEQLYCWLMVSWVKENQSIYAIKNTAIFFTGKTLLQYYNECNMHISVIN